MREDTKESDLIKKYTKKITDFAWYEYDESTYWDIEKGVRKMLKEMNLEAKKEERERIANALRHNILLISENCEEPGELWVLKKINKLIDSL